MNLSCNLFIHETVVINIINHFYNTLETMNHIIKRWWTFVYNIVEINIYLINKKYLDFY